MKTLNDICEVITCGVAKRPEYFKSGIPFLSSKNVKKDRFILDHYNFISELDYQQLTKHNKPEKGDILYTRVGSFGEAAVVDFDFKFAVFVSLTLIKPKHDVVQSRYLMHYLNSPEITSLAGNSTSGIGVQNLNVNVVRKFPINLPPLPTQQKIASILDAADTLRQKDKVLLAKYDELTQSLFLDMFGDPVKNEKGWEKVSLSEYGSFKNGLNFNNTESGVRIKYLGVGDFKSKSRIDKAESLSDIELNSLPNDSYLLNDGDLVFVRSNGNRALVGRCVEVYPKNHKLTFSGFCIRYRINSQLIKPTYLSQLFRNKSFKNLMLESGQGANIQNINQQILSGIDVPLPSLTMQDHFVQSIQLIEDQKAIAQKSLKKSEELFNSLLQKAFKGELV